jgi:O-antigen/teichoic acid export membrane protein
MGEPDHREPGKDRAISHHLARNTSFLLAGQVATALLSLILTALLGRWLGVVEFGIYYLLIVWSTFAYVLIDWGQSAYLIRKAVLQREDDGHLLGSALAFRTGLAIFVTVLTAAFVKIIGHDGRTVSLALFAIICGLPFALSQTYGYMFRAQNRMDLDASVVVSSKALTVAVAVPALILGGGLPAIILLQAFGGLGGLFLAMSLARKIRLRAGRPDGRHVRDLAFGGAPIALFFLAIAIQPFVDAIILAAMAPPEVVGWYGAARNIIALSCAPAMILGAAYYPEFARVAGSKPELRLTLQGGWKFLLVLGTMGAAFTFLFADIAVSTVYGGKHFEPSATLLRVFAPVLPILFVDMLLGNAITAMGKTKEIALVKAISVLVVTAFAILLIPWSQERFGNGAIGLVLAFGCAESMMFIAFIRLLPRGLIDWNMCFDALRATVVVGCSLLLFWQLSSITRWIGMPIGTVVFVGLMFVAGLIRKADLVLLVKLWPRKD